MAMKPDCVILGTKNNEHPDSTTEQGQGTQLNNPGVGNQPEAGSAPNEGNEQGENNLDTQGGEDDGDQSDGSDQGDESDREDEDDAYDSASGLTARDLSFRLALFQAGYDVSRIQPDGTLDEEAKTILKAKTTRMRTISRWWPRDPDGKFIEPGNSATGKMTSNGVQLWGATVYDFYRLHRFAKIPNYVTMSTGSKLAAWMKENGELDFAAEEIAAAEWEEDPKEVPPFDIAELVQTAEFAISMDMGGKSALPEGEDIKMEEVKESPEVEPSPFDPSCYPAPWPIVPFSYGAPKLQKHIPLRRLPQKLIIHDPWNLLSTGAVSGSDDGNSDTDTDTPDGDSPDVDWTEKPDVTHVYNLHLSTKAKERIAADNAEADKLKAKQGDGRDHPGREGIIISAPVLKPGPIEPPIELVGPPAPREGPIAEAHLYLSPAHKAGVGNHSVVYHAEWEVPRSMLMPHTLCTQCSVEDAHRVVAEEDGEDGSRKAEQWKEKSATVRVVERVKPAFTFGVMRRENIRAPGDRKPDSAEDEEGDLYTLSQGEKYNDVEFDGPTRPIHTKVPWQSPDAPYTTACVHERSVRPSTARVRVTAKLSLQHDGHLVAEAENYQAFPDHFFEHWNGFNLTPPLHDPTPVGAVVPQFYGFYKPEAGESGGEDGSYISPVMLLEDCGVPIDPEDLNIDDKNECASLYYRFHHAGWVHGSVAQRNILVQPGPLTMAPIYRIGNVRGIDRPELSFRIVDFGRSFEVTDEGSALIFENSTVAKLFELML